MSQGSTWNIWDLHLHTPWSALNNQYGDASDESTWERYVSLIENAAKERGIVAIGVTDYFTIDGYKVLLDFQQRGRLPGILLIPNVEFRIDKVVYRSKDASDSKRLNIHALLSPLLTPSEIEEHFLHDLEFVCQQEPFDPANTRKLKRANLTEFGHTLQKQHEAFQSKDPFTIGCMNAVVRSEQLKDQLDARFRGRYLLVLAEESLPLLDWDSQHHAVRKQLIQMSHAVFSANAKTRDFCLGKTHTSTHDFIEEFRSLKPCLWGCDAHGCDDRFLRPDSNRFCWIKGDVTWEGLKQVLYEPSDRVAIQSLSPEPSKSIYSLAHIAIPDTSVRDSLGVSATSLTLNPNLVAIIGGRGSGKTALLDLIASCFPEGKKLADINTSFFHRLYVDRGDPPGPPSSPIPISLTLASGDQFSKAIGEDQLVLDTADVVYLTQNHFEEYSANPDKLNLHIIALVFEHLPEETRQFQAYSAALEDADHKLEGYNLDIEHFTEQIGQRKEAENVQLKSLEGSRQDLQSRIAEIEATQGKQADEAKALSQLLHGLMESDLATDSAASVLARTRATVITFREQYQLDVADANAAIMAIRDTAVDRRFRLLPDQLPDVSAAAEAIEHNESELVAESTRLTEGLANTRNRIAQLDGLDRLLADHRESLSVITIEIIDLQGRIKETYEKEQMLASLEDARTNLFADSMARVVDLRDYLQRMIDRFRASSPGTLENIAFRAVVDLKEYPKYLQNLAQKLDNRVHNETEVGKALEPAIAVIRRLMGDGGSPEQFRGAAHDLLRAALPLKTKRSVSSAEYHNAVLGRFFRVGLDIQYSGKPLIELSMGERAIILLKVLLALGDRPLLIDQPEEHLDNRFIFDDLTPAFRDAKRRRQILIATHNANLVVNTDAEQVLIAENNGGVLGYRDGTLEDLAIRETIKTILEGGDEAFRKREERYGYRF